VPFDDLRTKLAASRQKHAEKKAQAAEPCMLTEPQIEQQPKALPTSLGSSPAAPAQKRQHKIVKRQSETTVVKQSERPEAPEAEEAVLGAMLQWPEVCVPEARRLLTRFHFYNPINRELFDLLKSEFDAGKAEKSHWLLSFTVFLRDHRRLDALGGPAYVTHLAALTVSEASLPFYADILHKKLLRRELIDHGSALTRAAFSAFDDDTAMLVEDFSKKYEQIRNAISGNNGSEPQTIEALQAFDAHHDVNAIIGQHRWLVRGGTALWAGGSGYGKSTLMMQLAIYWACGKHCFGLGPYKPRVNLIVQAENDLGDMAEMFQGVWAGIEATHDLDLNASKELIAKNVIIHRVVGKTGLAFLAQLDDLIQRTRADIVWIDPLFAFAGCDLMHSEKTGRFLREGLFPIAWKRNISLQVLHHIGKPVRGDSTNVAQMSDIDQQYLGFGTSEIQNAFRVVNVLLPIAKSSVYKLTLAKRGERAGAKDIEGNWTQKLFLERAKEGRLCWLQTTEPEGEKAYNAESVLGEMKTGIGYRTGDLQKQMQTEIGMSKATFYRIWAKLKTDEKVEVNADNLWFKSVDY
jgi:hypothetical protein